MPLGIMQREGEIVIAPLILQQLYDPAGRANQIYWHDDQRRRRAGGKQCRNARAGAGELLCFAQHAISIVLVKARVAPAANEKLFRRRGFCSANVID